MDTQGRVLTWNPGAEHIFGYTEAEIVGQPFARLFTAEDVQAGVPEREMRIAAERGVADDDRWHIRKDEQPLLGQRRDDCLEERYCPGLCQAGA